MKGRSNFAKKKKKIRVGEGGSTFAQLGGARDVCDPRSIILQPDAKINFFSEKSSVQ